MLTTERHKEVVAQMERISGMAEHVMTFDLDIHVEPARGDVVVYRLPSDPSTIYVKRIVGLAGDRVQFRDGRVIVNGKTITEPYIRAGDPKMTLNNTTEYVVPPGHFFAAGDNRANSADSRMQSHGFVPVAVALNCWINRRTAARIHHDGRVEMLYE